MCFLIDINIRRPYIKNMRGENSTPERDNMNNAFTKLANELWTELNDNGCTSVETTIGTLFVSVKSDEFHTFIEFACKGKTSTMTKGMSIYEADDAERFAAHLEAFLFFKCGFDQGVEIVA